MQKGTLRLNNTSNNCTFIITGETIEPSYNITFTWSTRRGGYIMLRINDGPETQVTDSTPSSFNDVKKLEIRLFAADIHYVEIDDVEYYEEEFNAWTDYTQYLHEGSHVYAYADDWY